MIGSEMVAALRASPRALKELLHFAFGRHEVDLPTGDNIGIQSIPIDAYAENARGADHVEDFDLLHAEAFKLKRLFAKGAHPPLTSKRRLELYKDIVERLAADERELLEEIRRHRRTPFPAITAELVARAWPGLLDEEPRAQSVAEPPRYDAAQWAPQEVVDPIVHVDPSARSEARRRYDEVYSRLKFG
jgi:hypothetical protein